MRESIVATAGCLLASALLAAQLSPDVQADRLWLRAERQIANEEYWSALVSLDEILDLQAEHEVTLPESFWFSHAVASYRAGLHSHAAASATRYVELTGRPGEHYLAALELLDVAEAAARREVAEAQRQANLREREDRKAETQRAARQAAVDAQAELASARAEEMAEVAAELSRLAPGMEMVVIPAGSFRMGCVSGVGCREGVRRQGGRRWTLGEFPVHEVTIPRPFAVSKHAVTFAQWDACVDAGGCLETTTSESRRRRRRQIGYRPDDEGWGRGNRPVINVSWDDAQRYVRWLSSRTGENYRLLSESEWEYAARAGTSTAYSWGNEIGSGRANCDGCGSQWDNGKTAPVGSFSANAWGLHDVHGNVYEWVQDCVNVSYNGAPLDGSSWESGNCVERVLRGGYWEDYPDDLRSAYRFYAASELRWLIVGFRVARTLAP